MASDQVMYEPSSFKFVWQGLPVRKHLIGKRLICRYIAIAENACAYGQTAEQSARTMETRRCDEEYKMGFIASILLAALINQIAALVFEWFKRRRNGEQC
jgi:hypothetical protein